MIRTLLAAGFLALYALLAGVPVIIYSRVTGTSDFLFRAGKWGVCAVMRICGVRIRVEGAENIPHGVCVFAANHVSNLDPPAVLLAVPRRVSYLAKQEIFKIPIISTAFRLGKIIPVNRADREAAICSIEHAVRVLREGISIITFPEGTRSKDGKLEPFKKGTFVMAIQAGAPVVPISILGSRELMRKGKLAVCPGEILVRFGEAIDSTAYSADERDKLLERIRAAVASGLQQGSGDQNSAGARL